MPDKTPCGIASPAAHTCTANLTTAHLAIVTGGRLALVAAFRIIYPLQPFLTNELNVDLRTVSTLITVQLAASMLSPIGGALADTRGERATMSGGLAIFALGTALCALSPSFAAFVIGYALVGLAVALYQPAAQAYLAARTPYARRGWALGTFENVLGAGGVAWGGAAYAVGPDDTAISASLLVAIDCRSSVVSAGVDAAAGWIAPTPRNSAPN
ncbi:MAG: MFS transporter [Roseiflexaceae bacterium]|nr:MFS transporter [Roseiflexaceae bacterium]